MAASAPLETLLKRDRAIVLASLGAAAALAWAYLIAMSAGMDAMTAGAMATARFEPGARSTSRPCSPCGRS